MRTFSRIALIAFAACALVGCGNSNEGTSDGKGDGENPKHLDLFVTLYAKKSHEGRSYWRRVDGRYEPNPIAWHEEVSWEDRTTVNCLPVYTGTTDVGDTFDLKITIGGEPQETKAVVYEGKPLEIVLMEGVKLVLEPNPLTPID